MSRFAVSSLGLLACAFPLAAATFHVDAAAPADGDGLDWPAAFNDLQDALGIATSGDEIHVAAGIYQPGADRADSFQLKTGVVVLGGFPNGGGERNPDPFTNATILSGEIGVPDDAADNCYHVVTGTGAGATAVLDGFTIRDGHADGDPAQRQQLGGGILCDGSGAPQFRNLLVTRNQTNGVGGAAYLNSSSPTFENVTFLENRTTTSGTGVAGEGGAIYLNISNPTFTSGAFLGNTAQIHGGAISLHDSDPTFTDVIFVGNTALVRAVGGALYLRPDSIPVVRNCSFTRNHADTGGAIWIGGSGALIQNSIIWGNTAATSPQIHGTAFAAGSTRNLVEGFTYNGGSAIASTNPRFVFQPFTPDGDWSTWDDNHYGDLRLRVGSPAIDFGNNAANSSSLDADGNPRPFDGDQNGAADIDLGPYEFSDVPDIAPDGEIHRWTFDGDTADSVGNIELALQGGATVRDGHLILNGTDAHAVSPASSPVALGARTFIAWVDPATLTQRRGGVLTIVRRLEGQPDTFDGIVYAEQTPGQWMNGSNNALRTVTNNGGAAETVAGAQKVMIAIIYGGDNGIDLYRNGVPYNTADADKGSLITYRVGETEFHLGQRHPGTTDSQRFFAGRIDEARIYNRALSAGEIADLHDAGPVPDTPVPPGPRNLARGAIARQSATEPVAFPDRSDAGIVIDGLVTAGNRNVAIPAEEGAAAWVEVELPDDALVQAVVIDNQLNNSARLRDITIELRDAGGAILATSPLLNPENAGFNFPNGPATLRHEFNSEVSTRIVRVTRTPDPDLSGSLGQGSPYLHDSTHLEFGELRIFGKNVAPEPVVNAFSATFDSRRANPNPTAQLWFDTETSIGNDFSPADGLLDFGGNVGIVVDGTDAVWQTHDQLGTTSTDNPWNRNLLDAAELQELHDLGWTFSATVRALSDHVDPAYSGFTGWGFSAAVNPGWDIGGNASARIGFAIGRTAADNSFFVTPQGQPQVSLGPDSGDDYHTITAICPPGSTVYEWFLDGVSQGTIDFATTDVGGLTEDNLSFGSGRNADLGGIANWKQVSLTSIPAPGLPSTDGLLFHLPFEPGAAGNELLTEKSKAPADKPIIIPVNGTVSQVTRGKIGGAANFPTAAIFQRAYLDASPALDELGDLASVTLSLWVKPGQQGVDLLGLSDSTSPFHGALLRLASIGGVPTLRFVVGNDGSTTGDDLTAEVDDILDGDWHHIVVAISPEAARLIYDGEVIDSADPADVTPFTSALDDLDTFAIGAFISSSEPVGGTSFVGEMDQLAIWNRSLSEAEIDSLFRFGYLSGALTRDADGDGLNHLVETALGTSDQNSDSDDDGIPDAEEIILGTDPGKTDSDGDGIPDPDEIAGPTSPVLADSDGDGFSDGIELRQGTLANDGLRDPAAPTVQLRFRLTGVGENLRVETSAALDDFDSLPSAQILHLGEGRHVALFTPPAGHRFFRVRSDAGVLTSALDAASFPAKDVLDTDGDGLLDPAEINLGTDPLLTDSDADGFDDFAEVLLGSDPLDPASTPAPTDGDDDGLTDGQEAALGTNPNLANSDGDGFTDLEEVNAGSDPLSPGSEPDAAVLRATAFTRAANGDITLDFSVAGSASNLRLQSSESLGGFENFETSTLTDLGGGTFRLEATPPAGHRFFRAAADSGGGVVTTRSAEFDPAGGTAQVAGEGDLFTRAIQLGGPFTGTLAYDISGTRPDGGALPPRTGLIEVDGASSVDLPLHLFNDLAVGPPAKYTVTLLDGPGLTAGLNASFTVTVEDDDARWLGTLQTRGETLDILLESLTDGTTTRQRLESSRDSALLPRGSFPVSASFSPQTFHARAANIRLTRVGTEVPAAPASIRSLLLQADVTDPDHEITPTTITGDFSLTLAPPAGTETTTTGRLRLLKEPPPAPGGELNLSQPNP